MKTNILKLIIYFDRFSVTTIICTFKKEKFYSLKNYSKKNMQIFSIYLFQENRKETIKIKIILNEAYNHEDIKGGITNISNLG